EDVAGRWDQLVVRSWVTRDGRRTLYQEGVLGKMRHPNELIARYEQERQPFLAGTAMFCGTLAVHGEIAPAERFEMELEDPVLNRKITHSYQVAELPIEG